MAMQSFNSPYCIEKRRLCEAAELHDNRNSPNLPLNFKQMEMILFPEGSLKNANNTIISEDHLRGKSVALYFGDGGDPKCRSFLPFLLQFYKTINESGSSQKIEVIFVSCDRDMKSFIEHRSHMPWLHIDPNDPLTDVLRKHFRVMREYEVPLYGSGPRSGVPSVVVIGSDGREEQFLHITSGREEGERAILRWDWRNTIFTANDLKVQFVQSAENGKQQMAIAKQQPQPQPQQQPQMQPQPHVSYPPQQRCPHTCIEHPPRY